ncbi:MAG TPA: hypothetical protein VKB04_11330 [Anaerolineales bacterium]|nr:hypothetical protein [Anaerolineales bacterium]
MTWDDFKKYGDEKLCELNKDEGIEISYMDFSSSKSDRLFMNSMYWLMMKTMFGGFLEMMP